MAAGVSGVLREAARLLSSSPACAVCCLTFCATGPGDTSVISSRRIGLCQLTAGNGVVGSVGIYRANVSMRQALQFGSSSRGAENCWHPSAIVIAVLVVRDVDVTYHTSLGGLEDRASSVSHGDDSDDLAGDVLMRSGANSARRRRRLRWFLGAARSVSTSGFLICWWDGGRARQRSRCDNNRWLRMKRTGR